MAPSGLARSGLAWRGLAVSAAVTLVATATGVAVANGSRPAPAVVGHLTVVQAVPGAEVEVRIDGESVAASAEAGEVLGPYDLSVGRHRVDFAGAGIDQAVTVDLRARGHRDVVLHLPAAEDGRPVVTAYRVPTHPIGSGKARVMVAHAAAAGAADVRLDGRAVFSNVANGEYGEADVPAGGHAVTLVATGGTEPMLGPVEVGLAERSITMVYAVSDGAGGLTVVAHSLRLAGDGSVVPTSIGTGSAGLVSEIPVAPFG